MENKALVVQSETVGFEVRWEMLFCLAEQTQWSYSTSPLTAHCPPTTSPPHTHSHMHIHTAAGTQWNRSGGLEEKEGWEGAPAELESG